MIRKGISPDCPVGIVVVDKSTGMTSHDVVSRMRRLAGTRKVGHAGTLDPDASGVLVLGVGRATKLLGYIAGADKSYEATIRLGVATTTDDAEGEVTSAPGISSFSADQLEEAIEQFRGSISQIPSSVSAIKVGGKRAYSLVRAGERVELKARQVWINRFEVLDFVPAVDHRETGDVEVVDVRVIVECSSGTYIRALARDLGQTLGSAGHLTGLRRTRVGEWSLENAYTLEELQHVVENGGRDALPFVSLDEAAAKVFRILVVDDDTAAAFRHGVAPGWVPPELRSQAGESGKQDKSPVASSLTKPDIFAVVAQSNPEMVLGLLRLEEGRFRTQMVMVPHQPEAKEAN